MAIKFNRNAAAAKSAEINTPPFTTEAVSPKPMPSSNDYIDSLVSDPDEAAAVMEKISKESATVYGSSLYKGEYTVKRGVTGRFVLRRVSKIVGGKKILSDCIGGIGIHYVNMKRTYNGVTKFNSEKFVCSDPAGKKGEGACAFCDADYRKTGMWVYDVVDLVGRLDKKTNAVVGVGDSRYLLLNEKRNTLFRGFLENIGEDAFKYVITVKAVQQNGANATTEYSYVIDRKSPVTAQHLAAPPAVDKLREFGAALSYEDQQKIIDACEPYRKMTREQMNSQSS